MKQTLQLKLGQHLTMTPQLQQAIKLLQLSSMELGLEVQEILDSNMMLERSDELDADPAAKPSDTLADSSNGQDASSGEMGDAEVQTTTTDIPEELPIDSQWEDVYDGNASFQPVTHGGDFSGAEFDQFRSATESLRDHLMWQVNLLPLTETDHMIAIAIIDALNDDGYLANSVEEILQTLMRDYSGNEPIEIEEIGAVLKQIQSLEPTGIAAVDLRECLLLQLRAFESDTEYLAVSITVCADYFNLLAARDYKQLMRKTKQDQQQLLGVINLIQSLNPKPGARYNEAPPEYVVPDVYVRKSKGRWKVELNGESIPQLRVNPYYASMIKRADKSEQNTSLKSHLQEAKWFIKSLQSRSETLLGVATAIVDRQRGFLEHGEEAMKPLVLHDIAEVLDMHESTISRVTTRKYMHTPRGIFELKYFFSSHVSTTLGGEASSTAIRAVIKKLIAAENSQKPLSDNKIAGLLSEKGIKVARRTVAKYREAMAIPPSNERKQLA